MAWNLASNLIRTGAQSLVPKLPLDERAASRAVRVFDKLRLPDVPGKPLLKDAAGDFSACLEGQSLHCNHRRGSSRERASGMGAGRNHQGDFALILCFNSLFVRQSCVFFQEWQLR
jgi:hypothetical protein